MKSQCTIVRGAQCVCLWRQRVHYKPEEIGRECADHRMWTVKVVLTILFFSTSLSILLVPMCRHMPESVQMLEKHFIADAATTAAAVAFFSTHVFVCFCVMIIIFFFDDFLCNDIYGQRAPSPQSSCNCRYILIDKFSLFDSVCVCVSLYLSVILCVRVWVFMLYVVFSHNLANHKRGFCVCRATDAQN